MFDKVLVGAGRAVDTFLFMKDARSVVAKMAAAKRNIIHEETNTILFGQMAKFNI
jgi:hypothetical protein